MVIVKTGGRKASRFEEMSLNREEILEQKMGENRGSLKSGVGFLYWKISC